MNNRIKEVLIQTRELLSDPSHWNRLGGAYNHKNKYCSPFDSEAKSYDLLSALHKFCGLSDKSLSYIREGNHDNLVYINRWSLIEFEMKATHSQLIKLLDLAIELSSKI